MNEQVTTNDVAVAAGMAEAPAQKDALEKIAAAIGPEDTVDFTWPDGLEGELVITAGSRTLTVPAGPPEPSPLDVALDAIEHSQEPSAATATGPARFESEPCSECGEKLPMHAPTCPRRPATARASAAEQARIDRSLEGDAEGGVEGTIA